MNSDTPKSSPAAGDATTRAVLLALQEARIPAAFHGRDTTLEPYESRDGVALLRSRLRDLRDWRGAVGLVVDTDGREGAKVSYLIARALVLGGKSVKCYTMPQFVDEVSRDEREFARRLVDEVDVLVILGFCEPGVVTACPYDGKTAQRMEWFISGQLMQGRGFILHATTPMLSAWWSKRLCAVLKEATVSVVTL